MTDPVTIEVTFVGRPTFTGTSGSGDVEWPPAPARVFAALVAGARGRFDDALRALENAPAPDIHAPYAIRLRDVTGSPPSRHATDLPSAKPPAPSKKTIGRRSFPDIETATVSQWAGAPYDVVGPYELADPVVRYIIDGDFLSDDDVAALDDAAADVGYLGRSTDTVAMSVTRGPAPERGALTLMRATGRPGRVRVWARGYLDALNARFALQNSPTPAPAMVTPHVLSRVTYVPVAQVPGTDLVGLRVTPSLQTSHATAVLRAAPAAIPMVNPHSGAMIGAMVDAADFDALADAVEAAGAAIDVGAPYWSSMVAAAGTVWTTHWPAHLPVDGAAAWAWIVHDLSAATGVDIGAIDVDLSPDRHARDGAPLTPGLDRWRVTVTFPEPVTGPLRLGPNSTPLYRVNERTTP